MNELKFASEVEALQHLADVTGKKVVVADMSDGSDLQDVCDGIVKDNHIKYLQPECVNNKTIIMDLLKGDDYTVDVDGKNVPIDIMITSSFVFDDKDNDDSIDVNIKTESVYASPVLHDDKKIKEACDNIEVTLDKIKDISGMFGLKTSLKKSNIIDDLKMLIKNAEEKLNDFIAKNNSEVKRLS